MNVLYLHPAAAFGGAAKSLIELYRLLRKEGVQGTVISPSGQSSEAFAAEGMDVISVKGLTQFDNTRYGHYRRLRWIILLREFFLLPFGLLALWKIRNRRFDIIHLNEITLLPMGLFSKWIFKIPLIIHVRSLQNKQANLRTRIISKLLNHYCDEVIAIDQSVADTLPADMAVSVIHNGFNLGHSVNALEQSSEQKKVICVGFLGVLIRLKGIYELIEAARILLKERNIKVRFLIAGENARQSKGIAAFLLKLLGFSENVKHEIETQIVEQGLQDSIDLRGFIPDVLTLYPEIDILAFPSHLDAAGRPVFEAAYFGIPSVVAVSSPFPDAIVHGETGLAIERSDPTLLADALEALITKNDYRKQLGENAKIWVEKIFSVERGAEDILNLYTKNIKT